MLGFRSKCRFETLTLVHNCILHFTTSTNVPNEICSNYLVNSLGFTHQQAISTSTKLSQWSTRKVYDYKFVDNANSVVIFLKNQGFDDTLIRNIVFKEPRLLACKVYKTLSPKLEFFHDQGFSRSDVIRVISAKPAILQSGLESVILPGVQILRQVLGSDDNVVKFVSRLRTRYLFYVVKYLLPNIALLTSYGIPIESIRKELLHYPAWYVQNPEVFKETIQSKCQIFKSFGWTQSDIETFLMKNASCFPTFSDERLKKKLDFLTNELQLRPAQLTSRNGFLTYSLEKRVVPRHKILQVLKDRGLLKKNPSLHSAIQMSEPCFLKRFVLPFKEVHQVYAKLTGCSLEILTQASTVSHSKNYCYDNASLFPTCKDANPWKSAQLTLCIVGSVTLLSFVFWRFLFTVM